MPFTKIQYFQQPKGNNMKNYLISTCLLVLAACGSGGSGVPNTQSTNSTAPVMPEIRTSGKQFYSWKNSSADAVVFDDADIKKVKINGLEINLANVGGLNFNNDWRIRLGGGTGTIGSLNPDNGGLPDNVGSYAVYNQSDNLIAGIIYQNGNNFAFYNGNFTDMEQIPVSGQAVYNTRAVYFDGAASQTLTGSQITADFGAKTVSGNIPRHEDDDIVLNANISGNKFTSPDGAATRVEGGFFGPRTAEIGGIFRNGDTVGAFAGKQQ